MITFSELLNKLSVQPQYTNYGTKEYIAIIYNAFRADLKNDAIISVMTADTWSTRTEQISGALFIIGDHVDTAFFGNMDVAIFPSTTKIDCLIRDVTEIIERRKLFLAYKEKLDLVLQNGSDIAEVFSLFVQYNVNPVCFGDRCGNILLQGNLHDDATELDETMSSWVNHGYVNYEYAKKHGNIDRISEVLESDCPVISDSKFAFAYKYPRMAYRVSCAPGTYEHYLSIIALYSPYRYYDKEMLIYTADAISGSNRSRGLAGMDTSRNHVLSCILDGTLSEVATIEDRMQSCGITPSRYYQVAVIQSQEDTEEDSGKLHETRRRFFVNSIGYLFPSMLSLVHQQDIVLLLQGNAVEVLEQLAETVKDYVVPYGVITGFSSVFSDVLQTRKHWEEAKLAVNVGSKLYNRTSFSFGDVYLEVLVHLANQCTSVDKFVDDDLLEMRKQDKLKGTDYYNTLREYVACGGNLTLMSKNLFIHRNTALYRMDRIKQQLNLSMDNIEQLMRLKISFECIKILENSKS